MMLGKPGGFHAPRSTGRYDVRDWLGGAVYRARVRESEHDVALKSLGHVDARRLALLRQRFEVASRARHPNLVSMYELDATTASPFYAMELIDGVNVLTYLTAGRASENMSTVPSSPRRRRADLERLRGVMRQIADGLSALHETGLRHDNLKPSNILVTSQGRVVLTDFGIAEPDLAHSSTLDSSDTYLSPEQASGAGVTRASDWYALGLVLYEALTGRLPFANNRAAMISMDAPPPSQLVDDVPAELDQLAMQLLDRDPSRRASRAEVLAVFDDRTDVSGPPSGSAPEFTGTDRFEIRRLLGRGGMGIVYEAYDRERGMNVALKTLLRLDSAALYRFKQEFRALSDVAHQNLVALYELVSTQGQWFFTMELLAGVDFVSFVRGRDLRDTSKSRDSADAGTLSFVVSDPSGTAITATDDATAVLTPHAAENSRSRVRARAPTLDNPATPIDWRRLRDALLQLAHGVHALHESGHMHRDIKPSNVLVTPEGRVVVLDFGVIAELGSRGRTNELVGTPAYMAPEQARGKITRASDWYSVGVMLYRVLTGSLPYVGSVEQMLFAKQDTDPVPVQNVRGDIPEDLASLCMALLQRDPGARPTGDEILSVLGATRQSRSLAVNITARRRSSMRTDAVHALAGRTQHLAELRAAFVRTRTGQGETLLVHGSSGMGKSALLDQFLAEVRSAPGAIVLAGRCYEREQVPYKGVDAAIDALSRYLITLEDHELAGLAPRDPLPLARMFPVLDSVPIFSRADRRTDASPEPQELRRRAFAALRQLLTKIAQRGPLVLFIDDAQWGDRDSAPLLAELMRPPAVPPLLLMLSYRSDDAPRSPLLSSLLSDDGLLLAGATTHSIHVGPLSDEDSRALANELLDFQNPRIAETIARESNGHPYFIHELARHAQQEGLTTGEKLSLDAVISGRVKRLPEPARRMMEIAAVVGQPVPQALLASAASIDNQERVTLINQLRVAQLLRTTGVADTDLAECYHDRIRELLVKELAPDRLAEAHARIAAAMLELPDAQDPEALALHFQGAGDVRRAFAYATKAADRAAAALAFDRAASLYRLALETGPDPETSRVLHAKLGDALRNAGRGREAAAAYRTAAEGATLEHRLVYQRLAAEQLLYSGHLDEGMRAVDDVLANLGLRLAKTPTRALASLLWRRFRNNLRGQKYTLRPLAEIDPARIQRIDACYGVGTSLAIVDVVRGNDFQALNLRLSLDAGEPYRIARSFALEAGFRSTMGHKQAGPVRQLLKESEQLAHQIKHPHALGMVLLVKGISAYELGDIPSASTNCEAAEEMLRTHCSGVAWELASARLFGTWSRFRLGQIAYLLDRVPVLQREAEERGDLYGYLAMTLGCPRIASTFATDDPISERKIAEEAIASWPGDWYQVQNYWADYALLNIDLYAGAADVAEQRLAHCLPKLRKALLLRVDEVSIYMAEIRARIALARAMEGAPRRRYLAIVRDDVRFLAKKPIPWCTAMADLLRAQLAALDGHPERELDYLAQAQLGFAGAQLSAYEMVVRHRRGTLLGGTLGATEVGAAAQWAREQGVASLTGMTRVLAPAFATSVRRLTGNH